MTGSRPVRQRLDQLLVELGLAESRAKAQRLILAGAVRVDGQPGCKAGQTVSVGSGISVTAPERFVSRGGGKLHHALLAFDLQVEGRICLDVGASTGGFTDCLLQHGASLVYALDVGRGQLHEKLRRDPRVVVMERCNARYLTAADLPQPPSFAVADVSFISLTKVLPAIKDVLSSGAAIVTLIKPQFEAPRHAVSRGGVVRTAAAREQAVEEVRHFGEKELNLQWLRSCESPLRGPAGNIEYLAHWAVP